MLHKQNSQRINFDLSKQTHLLVVSSSFITPFFFVYSQAKLSPIIYKKKN
jgi:hypothetical protein